jgi:hypothetical protein
MSANPLAPLPFTYFTVPSVYQGAPPDGVFVSPGYALPFVPPPGSFDFLPLQTWIRTSPGAPQYPVNTVPPAVTGSGTVGGLLSTTTGFWTNSPTGFAYQWYSGGTPIPRATTATYAPQFSDEGNSVYAQVTASNTHGARLALSNSVGPVTGPVERVLQDGATVRVLQDDVTVRVLG